MQKSVTIAICMVLVLWGCANQVPKIKRLKPQRYTAYNIWIHPGTLFCINFKQGEAFIPAGTPVENISIQKDEGARYIHFKIASTGQEINIQFNGRWHPGQTIRSYKKGMFTKKKFTKLTRGLSNSDIRAIKAGIITEGMSKRAVLVSYGPPPEHYTRDLSDNEWYYWLNRIKKKKICFDENDRAKRCGPSNSDRL